MIIKVKVITKASANEVIVLKESLNEYKIKTTQVAEKGKANVNIVKQLAKHLQISPSQIRIVSGHKSNNKTLEINE